MNPVDDNAAPDTPDPRRRVRRSLWVALGVAVVVAGVVVTAAAGGRDAPAAVGPSTTVYQVPPESRFSPDDPLVKTCQAGQYPAAACDVILRNDTAQLDPVIKPFIEDLETMFGDRYGGHWFDARVRPSLFVIGVVEPTDPERARIAELAGHNPRVVIQAVRYSRAQRQELESAARDMVHNVARGDEQIGPTDHEKQEAFYQRLSQLVTTLGFNVKSQKFEVGMPSPNPELEARIRAMLPAEDLDLRICRPGSEASGGPCTQDNVND